MQTKLIFHRPVLLNEAVDFLNIVPTQWYVDATAGGGGHTWEIIRRGGNVIAIDEDREAIEHIQIEMAAEIGKKQLLPVVDSFVNLQKIISELRISEIKGIIFDLGMSTYQITCEGRGFSFMRVEPLDMRMSQDGELTAEKIVNSYSLEKLEKVLITYGEEIFAKQMAVAIIVARKKEKIRDTGQLKKIAEEVYERQRARSKIHPATRMFQAIRIEVNDELNALKIGLGDAMDLVSRGGRVVVISFHSLEDRIVKNLTREYASEGKVNILTKKSLRPNYLESSANPAARSAKLRAVEKLI